MFSKFGLTLRQGVEIGVGFGIGCVDRVQFSHCLYVAQCLLDVAAYVLVGIQLWFLRQVADLDSGLWACLAVDVRIDPGHDPQQRGFSRTVQTEHADLGTRKKDSDMSRRICRFGGTILLTRFMVKMYWAIALCRTGLDGLRRRRFYTLRRGLKSSCGR